MPPLATFMARIFTKGTRWRVAFLTVCFSILLALPAALPLPAGARASASCDVPQLEVFRDYIRIGGTVQPKAMAAADFNGDGLLDVAVADRESSDTRGSVAIFLGD